MILLRDRLIVKPDAPRGETSEGLSTISQDNVKRGTVVEVGKDVKDVMKGDHIIYSPFHYDPVDEGNIIIAEEDVWAILNR